jgi:PAS domain-containing protein
VLHLWHAEPKDIPEDDRGFFETVVGMLCVVLDRKLTEEALERSEARYRARFETSPIPQWEEDISEMRKHLETLRSGGVSDFVSYFSERPQEFKSCVKLARILEANKAVFELLGAATIEEMHDLKIMEISRPCLESYLEWLNMVADGQVEHVVEVQIRPLTGEARRAQMRIVSSPGYKESGDRIMISMIDLGALEE